MELKTLGKKVKGLTDGGEDRGVSPVIGVILMVAITVILAAVIGAFVLGLGDDLGNSAGPQNSLTTAANPSYDAGNNDNGEAVSISHNSGDGVDMADIRVVIRNADTNAAAATFDADTAYAQNSLELQLNGTTATASEHFGVGDTLVVNDTTDATAATALAAGEYRVQIVHLPSDSTLEDRTVTLSGN